MIKRCQYCRPRWTYGVDNRQVRAIIAWLWPAAFIRESEAQDRAELKLWKARWERWEKIAVIDARNYPYKGIISDRVMYYQQARRREMEATNGK